MRLVIFVPQECTTAVLAAVSKHRGRVQSSEYVDGTQKISARVPHAEVGGFASTLWRQTDGRARTSMVLCESWPALQPPPGEPREPAAGVREPRPRVPVGRSGAVAVPEPNDEFRLKAETTESKQKFL
jgi:translation elongation factor EF-G